MSTAIRSRADARVRVATLSDERLASDDSFSAIADAGAPSRFLGINKLRGILPRFSFRVPECERGLEALCAYHGTASPNAWVA
jgi:hypothetical protein